jgi:hypothetical protein
MSAKMYFLAVLTPPEVNNKVLEWKYYMREHFGCVWPWFLRTLPSSTFWMNEELRNRWKRMFIFSTQQDHSK